MWEVCIFSSSYTGRCFALMLMWVGEKCGFFNRKNASFYFVVFFFFLSSGCQLWEFKQEIRMGLNPFSQVQGCAIRLCPDYTGASLALDEKSVPQKMWCQTAMSNQINQCWRHSVATQRKRFTWRGFSQKHTHSFLSARLWMESYIHNVMPDVGKKYPFCKLLLVQIKENVSGGMEERIMVNL